MPFARSPAVSKEMSKEMLMETAHWGKKESPFTDMVFDRHMEQRKIFGDVETIRSQTKAFVLKKSLLYIFF